MNFLKLVAAAAVWACLTANLRAAPLALDPQHSKIEVAVSCTVDSFVGHLDKYSATIECNPAAALPAKAVVSFNFADLKTGNPDRDAEMLKWLDYGHHATAGFQLTGWSRSGTTNIAEGQLTIHGVAVAVKMPVVVSHTPTNWDFTGQASFDYRDFKLAKIRKALVLTVNPKLTVTFHLTGTVAAAK